MSSSHCVELPKLELVIPSDDRSVGTRIFAGLVELACSAMAGLERIARDQGRPVAAMSRIRGTGRGVHFGDFIRQMESEHPIRLISPFEGSNLVAGAAWVARSILGKAAPDKATSQDAAIAKLRWDAGADDLPLHVHDHSARFIIVLDGRGYFHVSDQSPEKFDGTGVRTIPARERDVFAFTPGLLHTFSTAQFSMTLLSVQMPYLAFDDPDQFRLPHKRWVPRENPEATPPRVVCDPWWAIGLGGC